MTYGKFHWIFNFPLLLVAAVFAGPAAWEPGVLASGGLVLLAVMLFTTPWDNYAVAKGIWGFPRERFSWKLIYLPVEEYLFFVIESLQVMWLCLALIRFLPDAVSLENPYGLAHPVSGVMVVAVLLVWCLLGWMGRGKIGAQSRWHYAWHLFYWFLPVIFLQWVIAWNVILPRWYLIGLATLIVGTYLSIADYLAIDRGIWHFDQKQISGWKFGGKMPWEEAAFFYLTAFLVAQSFVMLLPEQFR